MSQEPRRKEIVVLGDDHILRVSSGLAQEIGFIESIVLLQLEALTGISPNVRDGRTVTFKGPRSLKEEYFPWLSEQTIKMIIDKLEAEGYIVVGDHDRRQDGSSWWCALNYKGLAKLKSIRIAQPDEPVDPLSADDRNRYQAKKTRQFKVSKANIDRPRSILLHSLLYPGNIQRFRALMQRISNQYLAGWPGYFGELIYLRESTRDLSTRAGWEVLNHAGDVKIRIEAYEEQAGNTQVDFLDGTRIEERRVFGKWIDKATLAFFDMLVYRIPDKNNPPIEWDDYLDEAWPGWLPKRVEVFYKWKAIYETWIEMLEEYRIEQGEPNSQVRKPKMADLQARVFADKGKLYRKRHLRTMIRAGREGYFEEHNIGDYFRYLDRRRAAQ